MQLLRLLTMPTFNSKLTSSFDTIPEDNYLKEEFCYRKRCYSTGKIENEIFSWDQEPEVFYQSETLNNYAGGLYRNFHPINSEVKEDIEKTIILNSYDFLPASDYKVGVHQIRITANVINQGIPTPEGIHQDGFDFVSVCCINTTNVSGGISLILDANDYSKVVFEDTLTPGRMLLFSDRTYAHYTSNISPKLPGMAKRDVIVATFQYLRTEHKH